MKTMKKILAVILTLTVAMTMGMAVTATSFADTAGTITVNNAVNGQTYTAFKVFDVTYNEAKTSYNYSISSDSEFYDTISTFASNADNGMTLTQVGSSTTYNVKIDTTKFTDAKAAALAIALKADTTKPAGISAVASGGTAAIDVESLGYYFVDTTTGALCALDTTDNIVEMYEKNSTPSLKKEVEEAGTYGEAASADIGQEVNFKLTVNTGTNEHASGTGVDKDYVIKDTLPAGMDFVSTTSVAGDETAWTEGTQYTVSTETVDGATVVTYTFAAESVEALGQNKDIVVVYKAKLNDEAVIAEAGNTNTADLTYGSFKDENKQATVYTYALALEKYDSDGENLDGAVFTFPFTATLVQAGDVDTPAIYRVTSGTGSTDIKTPASGNIVVVGLDADTYQVSEKTPPEGFNQLEGDLSITVAETKTATADKTFTTSKGESVVFTAGTDDGGYQIAATSIVGVENMSGTELPSTGGMGTTLIYIIGALLVIGCGILLVARRRMNAK